MLGATNTSAILVFALSAMAGELFDPFLFSPFALYPFLLFSVPSRGAGKIFLRN
jgi:hypothetical protein